ncbi:hypothetical protein [Streptomyces sp. Z26]|uniref:SCO2583 family membrane protein n=1 Tax=Streptomyces sp. Z26 TaxID=2500177 RepID=UPI000EF16ABC|nr:hypothetical protein [Streptomyces sp. Z26]RLL66755.1 hypothetical protein D7M15_07570 [Streptomyces sp. Z26]
MAGREEPPQGPPDGSPGGGDEDYGALVFDESFVEAARLQEFSAQERMDDEEHAAVRTRPARVGGKGLGAVGAAGASRQGVVLVLLIVVAFATAVYMGLQNPYPGAAQRAVEPMRVTTLPLAPRGEVPGSTPEDLFEHSPAAQFRTGADGVTLPDAHGSDHFSESQVLAALTGAKDYVVASSLDPEVLLGNASRSVRILLDPAQLEQFDRSLERPRDDGRHAATGWMVRFDPARVALADRDVRVNGSLTVQEVGPNLLEVTADHVFVYALRPASAGKGAEAEKGASLFTVRREMRFHFGRDDLRDHQLQVAQSAVRAGPTACTADSARALTPLLAGQRAEDDGPAGTDPYARDRSRASLCGVLSDSAQPRPTGR